MQIYSLQEINEFTRRVLALNMPDPIWLKAEVMQVSESRGHFFIELVENNPNQEEVIAQASAILWQNSYRSIKRQRGAGIKEVLQAGLNLQLQVQVDFHERFGYRLIVTDIDPNFTLGQVALQREKNLKILAQEKALEQNSQLAIRPVLQRLAIISSKTAAGYADFMTQLVENEYGYRYHTQLFPAAMQGQQASTEIITQLEKLSRRSKQYDAIIIIRGGGARLDLAAFDDLELCRNIAQMPLPVISGIGHEIDESLVDLVSHTALKTPTAVADFLINKCLQFEMQLAELAQNMQTQIRQRFKLSHLRLASLEERIQLLTKYYLLNKKNQLDQLEKKLESLHPSTILARGYVLVERDQQIVRYLQDLKPNEEVDLFFQDGKAKAIIKHLNPKQE